MHYDSERHKFIQKTRKRHTLEAIYKNRFFARGNIKVGKGRDTKRVFWESWDRQRAGISDLGLHSQNLDRNGLIIFVGPQKGFKIVDWLRRRIFRVCSKSSNYDLASVGGFLHV